MTAQQPERLINENPSVDLSLLDLYFVGADLPVLPKPPNTFRAATSLWRGYVGTWRLNADQSFELLQFEFPSFDDSESTIQTFDPVKINGDFEITLRPYFSGPDTTLLFANGKLLDESNWKVEDQTISVVVNRNLGNSGLLVDFSGGVALVPKSLLLDQNADLSSMAGQHLFCQLFSIDRERRMMILKQIPVPDGG